MPASCPKLKYLHISDSPLSRTFDLELTPNLETLFLINCREFVELNVSVASPNLKNLNLSNSSFRSLDLELIPNLEILDLENCDELVEINDPAGCLKKVGKLKLSGCSLEIPEDLGRLECLENPPQSLSPTKDEFENCTFEEVLHILAENPSYKDRTAGFDIGMWDYISFELVLERFLDIHRFKDLDDWED
ncbi:Toll/interleukin-1 receptor domain-containing protein [Tanacetum coccineum]